jgi:hypothetical protein
VTVLKETIKLNNGRTQTLRTARTPKPVLVPAPPPVPVPGLVRNGRRAAIGLAGAIAVASFVLSFAGLANLALRSGIPERLAWLCPLMLGGTIAQATVAIIALAAYPAQARNRRFTYGVMIASVGSLDRWQCSGRADRRADATGTGCTDRHGRAALAAGHYARPGRADPLQPREGDLKMKWTKKGQDYVSGLYRIHAEGDAWHVDMPVNGGMFDTVPEAKRWCTEHESKRAVEEHTHKVTADCAPLSGEQARKVAALFDMPGHRARERAAHTPPG